MRRCLYVHEKVRIFRLFIILYGEGGGGESFVVPSFSPFFLTPLLWKDRYGNNKRTQR